MRSDLHHLYHVREGWLVLVRLMFDEICWGICGLSCGDEEIEIVWRCHEGVCVRQARCDQHPIYLWVMRCTPWRCVVCLRAFLVHIAV